MILYLARRSTVQKSLAYEVLLVHLIGRIALLIAFGGRSKLFILISAFHKNTEKLDRRFWNWELHLLMCKVCNIQTRLPELGNS